ncbi:MAG: electron transport complex subunit RsxC [Wenzhouxiangellaceae bacterium]|nr:electron transport complex subunit RsxC [Wenzhouxiangellaceae bacterium]
MSKTLMPSMHPLALQPKRIPLMLEVGRQLYRFPGGLRLRHHKQVACQDPLARLPLPERLYLPLVQHQGPAGELQVAAGDRVRRGQPLTRARNDCEVPIHAPAAGRIEAIRPWPVSWPPGTRADCLVLVSDANGEAMPATTLPDWMDAAPERIVEHLRDGGLAGLGGAMFPTAAKLRGDWAAPEIHTLILNGSECEPYIACDEMLMRNRPEAIVRGGMILARALGAENIVIAIEDPMSAVREALEAAAKTVDPSGHCLIAQVSKIYPEGGERQLIQVLTGAEVPHDGLPQDLGLACLNVGTAAAAHDIVIEGRPLSERIVTVSGPAIAKPRNVLAPLGAPIRELIAFAGGPIKAIDRLVLGGPMSGIPLADDSIPIVKGSNCILALGADDTRREQPVMPCINCGECVRVCPASLLPQTLYQAIRGEDHDQARELNVFDCIECGCCAHVCPSHIPLVDYYRHEKGVLRARGIEDARAEQARRRFEAREQRLAEREAERQRKREQREQRLKAREAAKSEVEAAVARARARSGAGDDGAAS